MTGIMTGITTSMMTGVAADVKPGFHYRRVRLLRLLSGVSTHLHQTYSRAGMLVLIIPLH